VRILPRTSQNQTTKPGQTAYCCARRVRARTCRYRGMCNGIPRYFDPGTLHNAL